MYYLCIIKRIVKLFDWHGSIGADMLCPSGFTQGLTFPQAQLCKTQCISHSVTHRQSISLLGCRAHSSATLSVLLHH